MHESLIRSASQLYGSLSITSPSQDGTKISLLKESAVTVSGKCSQPGWTIFVSGSASGMTSCQSNKTWSLNLNFSAVADGTVSISAIQINGSFASPAATRSFVKDTAYCANSTNYNAAPFAGGTGIPADPYLICSTTQLLTLSNNAGYWVNSFQLKNDVDLSGQIWTSIQSTGSLFDGNQFTVNNLTMNVATAAGFFQNSTGTIQNLGLLNANITTTYGQTGILVGHMGSGTVNNCYSTGVLNTQYHSGGLIGESAGTVSNSWSSVTVTSGANGVGGLIGHNFGAMVTNSYATGSVTGASLVGGLAGVNDQFGAISNCYATGAVSGTQDVGGLVGENGYTGPGNSNETIVNSYATGAVNGSVASVGGLLGYGFDTGGLVQTSYSVGAVSGPAPVGGLIGSTAGTTANSYWDVTTSGQATSGGGTGLTDSQMQQQTNFNAFDFTTPIWIWIPTLSNYPVLSWQ